MYPLTLRAKTILIGIVVAGVLSFVASAATFFLTREFLLRQRENGAVTQVLAAARLASSALAQSDESLGILSASAQLLPGSRAALYQSGSWQISGIGFTNLDIPESLLLQLENGLPARQRAMVGSNVSILVGFPLLNYPNTWFVGVVPLNELERSLEVLRTTLLVGSILAALGGGVIGNWVSRRMMEPLREFSSTAREVSLGDLTKRVNEPREPDLARIAQIFNEMTFSLQRRIDREARFGATVSHELRSPLTVIRTAADIIASMRSELPPRAQMSSDLLTQRVEAFEKILNDLIEISRYQSGSVEVNLEELSVRQLVETMASRKGIDLRLVEVEDATVVVDVRRFQQIFENIHKNAELYAGGLDAIRGVRNESEYELHFDDSGIGVTIDERDKIFEPFLRGGHHAAVPGSGLGLTITLEHAHSMGGELVASASPTGGARFTLSLGVAETQL